MVLAIWLMTRTEKWSPMVVQMVMIYGAGDLHVAEGVDCNHDEQGRFRAEGDNDSPGKDDEESQFRAEARAVTMGKIHWLIHRRNP
jgi:hypothetical protein